VISQLVGPRVPLPMPTVKLTHLVYESLIKRLAITIFTFTPPVLLSSSTSIWITRSLFTGAIASCVHLCLHLRSLGRSHVLGQPSTTFHWLMSRLAFLNVMLMLIQSEVGCGLRFRGERTMRRSNPGLNQLERCVASCGGAHASGESARPWLRRESDRDHSGRFQRLGTTQGWRARAGRTPRKRTEGRSPSAQTSRQD
jgi:hypothetical protein